jgi:hypothetical protein
MTVILILKIQLLKYRPVVLNKNFVTVFRVEDGGKKYHQNVSIHIPDEMSQSGRPQSKYLKL